MRTVLPGKPQARLQAVDAVEWEGKRLVVWTPRILCINLRF